MSKTTVAAVLIVVTLILLAGVALRAGGGRTLSRWLASMHGNAGH
jgi:hypothetical protein